MHFAGRLPCILNDASILQYAGLWLLGKVSLHLSHCNLGTHLSLVYTILAAIKELSDILSSPDLLCWQYLLQQEVRGLSNREALVA